MPSLGTTVAATTVTVEFSDGDEIVFDESIGGAIKEWNQSGTNRADTTYGLHYWYFKETSPASGTHVSNEEPNAIITILINDPNILKLRITGELDEKAGYTYIWTVTVFPNQYIWFDIQFVNNTAGTITFSEFRHSTYTNSTNYASEVRTSDGGEDTTPTYNTEWWYGTYHAALKSMYMYIIHADVGLRQETRLSAANIIGYDAETSFDVTVGSSVRHVACMYIGGTEDDTVDETAIEADGEDKKDAFIS